MKNKRFIFRMGCYVYAKDEKEAREIAEKISWSHLRDEDEMRDILVTGNITVNEITESQPPFKQVSLHSNEEE